jgi:hypothetical protein
MIKPSLETKSALLPRDLMAGNVPRELGLSADCLDCKVLYQAVEACTCQLLANRACL